MKTILVVAFVLFAFSVSAYEHITFNQLPIRSQKLAVCENNRFDPALRILDTNSKYSTGILMYQRGTFISFGRDSGILPRNLTNREIDLLIKNPWIQSAITEWALDNGLASHWFFCSKRAGFI